MTRIHPKKHNWAWIYNNSRYEYNQCQHPTCGKIMRVEIRTGKGRILSKEEARRFIARL